mmetsp:Transcript_4152/g.6124  ORF Transcript_4152/g.6124 Transcript_4152/m.6124 type:complete len:558 (-) Transcript_4152:192-1865(-)
MAHRLHPSLRRKREEAEARRERKKGRVRSKAKRGLLPVNSSIPGMVRPGKSKARGGSSRYQIFDYKLQMENTVHYPSKASADVVSNKSQYNSFSRRISHQSKDKAPASVGDILNFKTGQNKTEAASLSLRNLKGTVENDDLYNARQRLRNLRNSVRAKRRARKLKHTITMKKKIELASREAVKAAREWLKEESSSSSNASPLTSEALRTKKEKITPLEGSRSLLSSKQADGIQRYSFQDNFETSETSIDSSAETVKCNEQSSATEDTEVETESTEMMDSNVNILRQRQVKEKRRALRFPRESGWREVKGVRVNLKELLKDPSAEIETSKTKADDVDSQRDSSTDEEEKQKVEDDSCTSSTEVCLELLKTEYKSEDIWTRRRKLFTNNPHILSPRKVEDEAETSTKDVTTRKSKTSAKDTILADICGPTWELKLAPWILETTRDFFKEFDNGESESSPKVMLKAGYRKQLFQERCETFRRAVVLVLRNTTKGIWEEGKNRRFEIVQRAWEDAVSVWNTQHQKYCLNIGADILSIEKVFGERERVLDIVLTLCEKATNM